MEEAERLLYTCGEPSCLASGTAEEMFNTPCNPAYVTLQELKERVRCPMCARDYTQKMRSSGTHRRTSVFSLAATLAAMERLASAREAFRSWGDDYLRWYKEVSEPMAPQPPRAEIEQEYLAWYLRRHPNKRNYRYSRF